MRTFFAIDALVLLAVFRQCHASLPQVDLGYEIHQASVYDSSMKAYNFSNIRFAQPPIGDLRFAAPKAPEGKNPVVQTGNVGAICPQALPLWQAPQAEYVEKWVLNTSIPSPSRMASEANLARDLLKAHSIASEGVGESRSSEDCLFLDVVVPQKIYDQRNKTNGTAPVLVYIYGGGYAVGEKSNNSPQGLFDEAYAQGSDGFIWVALNYRLGALGWMAGPSLESSGGSANAGLYDQRLALRWVKDNIRKFGGNPDQVTVIGGSAGAGSIMHQLTAFGSNGPVDFQRAVILYPGYFPWKSTKSHEMVAQQFLGLLGASSFEEARSRSSAAVISANLAQVAASPWGQYTYGPSAGDAFTPDLPGILLQNGNFARNVSIMLAHNQNEGVAFAPPYVASNIHLAQWWREAYPGISSVVVNRMLELYPAVYNGSYGYFAPFERISTVVAELAFTCNNRFITEAYNNKSYSYEWGAFPALHGADAPYLFYSGPRNSSTANPMAALAIPLQRYLLNFLQSGNPNGGSVPSFPTNGDNGTEVVFNTTGVSVQRYSEQTIERCRVLQDAPYTGYS